MKTFVLIVSLYLNGAVVERENFAFGSQYSCRMAGEMIVAKQQALFADDKRVSFGFKCFQVTQ